jgi:hypothetical protein
MTDRRGGSGSASMRKPSAPTSRADRRSSRPNTSLPLKVANCQEIPNRFRQWASSANMPDKARSSPRATSTPNASIHASVVSRAVSSVGGASLSSIVLLSCRTFGLSDYRLWSSTTRARGKGTRHFCRQEAGAVGLHDISATRQLPKHCRLSGKLPTNDRGEKGRAFDMGLRQRFCRLVKPTKMGSSCRINCFPRS